MHSPQCADGESNEIVSEKTKTVVAWKNNTFGVKNHLVPNPTRSKLKSLRIEKIKNNVFFDKTIEKITIAELRLAEMLQSAGISQYCTTHSNKYFLICFGFFYVLLKQKMIFLTLFLT